VNTSVENKIKMNKANGLRGKTSESRKLFGGFMREFRKTISSAKVCFHDVRKSPTATTIEPRTTSSVVDEYYSNKVDVMIEREMDVLRPNLMRGFAGAWERTKYFQGEIKTVKVHENNPLIREIVTKENGRGKVLVIDGRASIRCALLGGEIAQIAEYNQWEGIIVNGMIRDTNEMKILGLTIPILALGTNPIPSSKRDPGVRDVEVTFGDVTFKSGNYIYADQDGVLVTRDGKLHKH